MSETLSDLFIQGLKKYYISYEDIVAGKWKYCGGNPEQRHVNYWKIVFGDKEFPKHEDECICGHFIVNNCYITDGEKILVLGNCCVKKFIPQKTRTCEKCGAEHKNRKINRCKSCRKGLCDKCSNPCSAKYPLCQACKFGVGEMLPNQFTFGKYKGELINDVFVRDPEYCSWCVKNVESSKHEIKQLQELFELKIY